MLTIAQNNLFTELAIEESCVVSGGDGTPVFMYNSDPSTGGTLKNANGYGKAVTISNNPQNTTSNHNNDDLTNALSIPLNLNIANVKTTM
ncbi:MAG TPA: hypothetical protein V6D25_07965 [Leptolyngbyaceae cyanobacterium]